ncbi:hypothetical protein [Mycolicibacterium komossense]|uniref:Uncharacterized protein n=1 Tax=Mycolicibacterium komossense TaxID=1779 RepID=A0ABT3C8P5_9MYCO|nr:hypothetical protein [Mycolicibacterium komossense]MCV7225853.1 hypothetical protein [Mycolicibacterium komossense]
MSWQPSYATAADLASWRGIDPDDPALALATEAASRAIDKATGRQFGVADEPVARFYHPDRPRHEHRHFGYLPYFGGGYLRHRHGVDIDDLMTTDGLEVLVDVGGAYQSVTDFDLTPLNGAANGRPWTRLETTTPLHGRVQITATWGWTAAPDAVKLATLIQGSRFYERRESPAGAPTLNRVDDVEMRWSAGTADLDADVLASIAPFRRLWAAV